MVDASAAKGNRKGHPMTTEARGAQKTPAARRKVMRSARNHSGAHGAHQGRNTHDTNLQRGFTGERRACHA